MNTVYPFIISYFLPGFGQLILKNYRKGILIICLWLISIFLIPNFNLPDYLLPIVIHFVFVVWSLFDLFDNIEKLENRKSATRKLAFSIIVAILLIPTFLYFLFSGLYKSGNLFVNEFLNEDRTKTEMNEISTALGRYKEHYGHFPSNYDSFISSKPIRSGWKSDSWNNPYKYVLTDSVNCQLISAGKDQVFDNEDDIIISK